MLTADMIKKEIGGYFDEIVSFRRHLHMHPETGLDTKETEAYIRSFLEGEGVGVLESQVGVIGCIKGGKSSGCCVALRADMDALPLAEENDVPYKSQVPGKMHACGHDGHTAMLMGAAHVLNKHRGELCADVVLIFQPAEEGPFPGGAVIMLDDLKKLGLFEKIKAVIALHLTTEHPAGKVAIGWGSMMASTDEYDIEITGVGGHVGLPHRAVDALSIAAKFVTDMESFMSRRIDPFDSAVFGTGVMRAGSARNIIPEKAVLSGSLRCQREETRLYVLENAEKILKALCEAYGAKYEMKVTRGLPVLRNDDAVVAVMEESAEETAGADNIIRLRSSNMGAEDFAFFSEVKPAAFVWIGARNEEKGFTHMMHNPKFDIDEEALKTGAALLCRAAAALGEKTPVKTEA